MRALLGAWALGVCLGAAGMATVVVVTAEPRIAPAGLPLTAPVVPAPPVCETPLASLGGSELLWLRRSGGESAALVVTYGGIDRGQLVHLDLATKTVTVPNRPVFGWAIGGPR